MIDPDKVTPGYWYVLLNPGWLDSTSKMYEIVEVQENGMLKYCGVDEHLSCDKYHPNVFFIAPVPDPIGRPEETIKQLKEDLNLPSSANTADVFRAALSLAKKVKVEHKE